MKEKTLLKLAIGCILVGLPLLLFLSARNEVTAGSGIFGEARAAGVVESVKVRNGVTFIELKVPVVIFDEVVLQKGDLLEVEGELTSWKGKREIVAERFFAR